MPSGSTNPAPPYNALAPAARPLLPRGACSHTDSSPHAAAREAARINKARAAPRRLWSGSVATLAMYATRGAADGNGGGSAAPAARRSRASAATTRPVVTSSARSSAVRRVSSALAVARAAARSSRGVAKTEGGGATAAARAVALAAARVSAHSITWDCTRASVTRCSLIAAAATGPPPLARAAVAHAGSNAAAVTAATAGASHARAKRTRKPRAGALAGGCIRLQFAVDENRRTDLFRSHSFASSLSVSAARPPVWEAPAHAARHTSRHTLFPPPSQMLATAARRAGRALAPSAARAASSHAENTNTFIREVRERVCVWGECECRGACVWGAGGVHRLFVPSLLPCAVEAKTKTVASSSVRRGQASSPATRDKRMLHLAPRGKEGGRAHGRRRVWGRFTKQNKRGWGSKKRCHAR